MNDTINITATSKPDYDEWGFDTYWSPEEWIAWHKALKRAYGQQKANMIWAKAWYAQGFWDKPFSFYKYNKNFTDYLRSQGIDIGNPFSKVFVASEKIVDATTEAAVDVASGAARTLKATSSLLPLLVLGVLGGGLYLLYNEIKKNGLSSLVDLTPAGAVAKKLKK